MKSHKHLPGRRAQILLLSLWQFLVASAHAMLSSSTVEICYVWDQQTDLCPLSLLVH